MNRTNRFRWILRTTIALAAMSAGLALSAAPADGSAQTAPASQNAAASSPPAATQDVEAPNLRFERLPLGMADFYVTQSFPLATVEPPAFCKSKKPLAYQPTATYFGFHAVLDESKGTGTGYDTLYIDFDGDGDYRNDPIYKAGPCPEPIVELDSRSTLAYFDNVEILRDSQAKVVARVQVKFEKLAGDAGPYELSMVPEFWAVGTVTAGQQEIRAALIDGNWNGTFGERGGLRPQYAGSGDDFSAIKGDILLLDIKKEGRFSRQVPGRRYGSSGTPRVPVTKYLALDSGIYRVYIQQLADGVVLRLLPAKTNNTSIDLKDAGDAEVVAMYGTETCVLLCGKPAKVELPFRDTYYIPATATVINGPTGSAAGREISRPITVSGKVVDAGSGKAVPDFTVIPGMSWGGPNRPYWQRRQATQGKDGQYTIRFGDANYPEYMVRVEAPGYMPVISRAFKVDEVSATYDCELSPGRNIEGIVLLPDGKPAEGAKVALCTPSQGLMLEGGQLRPYNSGASVSTDASGRFSFPPEVEPFTLVAVHDVGYAEQTQSQFEELPKLQLRAWGRVEGVLRVGAKPGAGESVRLDSSQAWERQSPRISHDYSIKTDAEGRFAFDRVVPADVSVARVIASDRMTHHVNSIPVSVEPGKTTKVTLGGIGRPVVGKLVFPEDVNIKIDWPRSSLYVYLVQPQVDVPEHIKARGSMALRAWYTAWQRAAEGRAYRRAERHYGGTVRPDGSFRVEDVPAGNYQFSASLVEAGPSDRWDTAASVSRQFEIPEMEGGRSDEPIDLGALPLTVRIPVEVGGDAAPFEVKTFDDKTIKSSDCHGKCILLHFWLAGYEDGLKEMATLKAIYERYGHDKRFVMISFNLDAEPAEAKKQIEQNKLAWLQVKLGDASKALLPDAYGLESYPWIVLVSPDGKIQAKGLGGKDLTEAVDRALGSADKPAAPAATQTATAASQAVPYQTTRQD